MTAPVRRVFRYRTPVRLATSAIAIRTNAAPHAAPEVMWWRALNRATAAWPAVAHPQGKAHAGTDADDPQDGRHQPGLGEGAGPVAPDSGQEPGPGTEGGTDGGETDDQHQVVAGGGDGVEELGGHEDRGDQREHQAGPGHLVPPDLEDDQSDEGNVHEVIGGCHTASV